MSSIQVALLIKSDAYSVGIYYARTDDFHRTAIYCSIFHSTTQTHSTYNLFKLMWEMAIKLNCTARNELDIGGRVLGVQIN